MQTERQTGRGRKTGKLQALVYDILPSRRKVPESDARSVADRLRLDGERSWRETGGGGGGDGVVVVVEAADKQEVRDKRRNTVSK